MPRKLSPDEALARIRTKTDDSLEIIGTRVKRDIWKRIAQEAKREGYDDMSSAFRGILERWADEVVMDKKGLAGVEESSLTQELRKRGWLVVREEELEKKIDSMKKKLTASLLDIIDKEINKLL